MNFRIPRGIIYQSIMDNSRHLLRCFSFSHDQKIVKNWEESFAAHVGSKYCVSFPMARTAFFYCLLNQRLPRGAEIIMPPISIRGMLHVVKSLGLVPVFVDITSEDYCFNASDLEDAINPNTKAILITYLFGITPDVDALLSVARKHQLFIVEDFSQCLNGEFGSAKIGSMGDVSIYSASSTKTLDTYGGGMLVSNNIEIAQAMASCAIGLPLMTRMSLIKRVLANTVRNVATSRYIFHYVTSILIRLVESIKPNLSAIVFRSKRYEITAELPQNWFFRYSSFQAQVGLELLPKISDSDYKRIYYANRLRDELKQCTAVVEKPQGKNVYWQFPIILDNRDAVRLSLQKAGIDSGYSALEFLPSVMPSDIIVRSTPIAEHTYRHLLFLPCHPDLQHDELNRITNCIKRTLADG
jgi:perosamine synthetase